MNKLFIDNYNHVNKINTKLNKIKNKYLIKYQSGGSNILEELESINNKLKTISESNLDNVIEKYKILRTKIEQLNNDISEKIQILNIDNIEELNEVFYKLTQIVKSKLEFEPNEITQLDESEDRYIHLFIKDDNTSSNDISKLYDNMVLIYNGFIETKNEFTYHLSNENYVETNRKLLNKIDGQLQLSLNELDSHYNKLLNITNHFNTHVNSINASLSKIINRENYLLEDIKYTNIIVKEFKESNDQNKYLINSSELLDAQYKLMKETFGSLITSLKKYTSGNKNILIDTMKDKLNSVNKNISDINKINEIDIIQTGGDLEGLEELELQNKINDKIKNYTIGLDKYNLLLGKLKNDILNYTITKTHLVYHIIFLSIIGTPKINNKYPRYKYINKDILNYYYEIINNIIIQINNNSQDNNILYFRRYHYITLLKLCSLLSYLINNIDNKIIDINNSSGDIALDFYVFNNFYYILDKYKSTTQE